MGNGSPLQYSRLENSTDRGTWQATVHGVAQSQTRLSAQACARHTHTHTHGSPRVDSSPSAQCLQEQINIHPWTTCWHSHTQTRVQAYEHTLYQGAGVSAPTNSSRQPGVLPGGGVTAAGRGIK